MAIPFHSINSGYLPQFNYTPGNDSPYQQSYPPQSGADYDGIPPLDGRGNNLPARLKIPPSVQRIKHIASEVIRKFKDIWDRYVKRIIKCTKIALQSVTLFANDDTVKKIKNYLAYLGLTALIGLGFELDHLLKDCKKLNSNIKLDDIEGIAWSSADIFTDFCEIIKSLISSGKAIEQFVEIPFLELFSVVVLPLSLILLTYNTFRAFYKLAISSVEFHQLPKNVEGEKGLEEFKHYLDVKVGITEKEKQKIIETVNEKYGIYSLAIKGRGAPTFVVFNIDQLSARIPDSPLEKQEAANREIEREITVLKSRKINKLSRNVDKRIANYMVNTRDALIKASEEKARAVEIDKLKHPEESPPAPHDTSPTAEKALKESEKAEKSSNALDERTIAENAVKDLKKLSIRKLVFTSIKALTCLLEWAMEILSLTLCPLAITITKLVFTSYKLGFSIFKEIYDLHGMHRGLKNPQFFLYKPA